MPSNEERAQREIRKATSELISKYLELIEPLKQELQLKLEQGVITKKAVNSVMKNQTEIIKHIEADLNNVLIKSVRLGFAGRIRHDDNLRKQVIDRLMNTAWTKDKKTLLKRLKDNAKKRKKLILRTMESYEYNITEVEQNARKIYDLLSRNENPDFATVWQLSRKIKTAAGIASNGDIKFVQPLFLALGILQRRISDGELERLKPAYLAVRREAEALRNKTIPLAINEAFAKKARYQIERIIRTEAARAWFDGFIAHYQNNDKVFGYRWKLSPRHLIFDQCDVIANINIGYGKGVYPKDNMPTIPRHPHCMCTLKPVYWSQVPRSQRLNISRSRQYVDGLSLNQCQQLFGVAGAEAVRNGDDWQKYLLGWDGFTKPSSRLSGIR